MDLMALLRSYGWQHGYGMEWRGWRFFFECGILRRGSVHASVGKLGRIEGEVLEVFASVARVRRRSKGFGESKNIPTAVPQSNGNDQSNL